MNKITVGIATYPKREKILRDSISSLYSQVDEMVVCLNGYESVPDWLTSLAKVEAVIPGEDMTDAGKFIRLASCQGYYFSCDDDLVYPGDYISRTLARMNDYPRSVVCYHGRELYGKLRSYYRSDCNLMTFSSRQPSDCRVHIGGTGVMAFHTDLIRLDLSEFDPPKMADIHFALQANIQKVPIVALAHECDWIRENPDTDVVDSIYISSLNSDEDQTRLVNSVNWSQYQ